MKTEIHSYFLPLVAEQARSYQFRDDEPSYGVCVISQSDGSRAVVVEASNKESAEQRASLICRASDCDLVEKYMSSTPRTDVEILQWPSLPLPHEMPPCVTSVFARQLERELAAANCALETERVELAKAIYSYVPEWLPQPPDKRNTNPRFALGMLSAAFVRERDVRRQLADVMGPMEELVRKVAQIANLALDDDVLEMRLNMKNALAASRALDATENEPSDDNNLREFKESQKDIL